MVVLFIRGVFNGGDGDGGGGRDVVVIVIVIVVGISWCLVFWRSTGGVCDVCGGYGMMTPGTCRGRGSSREVGAINMPALRNGGWVVVLVSSK